MPISINGTGSITGLSAGGLPDNSIVTADIADSAVTTAKLAQPMTLATAQASTSGTAIDFTGIPSWVKRVTVLFVGVSLNGGSTVIVQIGSGSLKTTDYQSGSGSTNSTTNGVSSTSGFIFTNYSAAADFRHGAMVINHVGNNQYISTHNAVGGATALGTCGAGSVTLSGLMDRLRITASNGTDTFDAGAINIMYEG